MSKHTEGPWRVGTPGPNGCYTVGTYRGLMTAMVAHSINEPDQAEQAKGDAHLIAAAPDLLEALQYMLDCQYDYDPRRQADCDMCAKARAAIAKARGEA